MRKATLHIKEFYDAVGWDRLDGGRFVDSTAEDLRDVSRDYVTACHRRCGASLPATGNLFLDCASGPVQYETYRDYSQHFRYRVCVDVSMRALTEAREAIGEHGLFVQADITSLPFREGVFDAVLSLHTIYHVPEDAQRPALDELYRVLSPSGTMVVVHSQGPHSPLNRLLMSPVRAGRLIKTLPRRVSRVILHLISRARARGPDASLAAPAAVTFFPRDYYWIRKEIAERLPARILCWRSVSVPWMRVAIQPWLGGKRLLALLFRLEGAFPTFFGRFGQYPMIVVRKPPSPDRD